MGWKVTVVKSGNDYAGTADPARPIPQGCTTTSDGVAQAVASSGTSGNDLHLTMSGTLAAGRVATVTCPGAMSPHTAGSPAEVQFSALSSADNVPVGYSAGSGYTVLAGTQATWIAARRGTGYQTGAGGGSLTVRFKPSTQISGSAATITITPSQTLWSADGATACTVKSGGVAKPITSAVAAGAALTVTLRAGAVLYADLAAEVACSDNLAVNGGLGAVTFTFATSGDTTPLTAQTGYTIVALSAVGWGGANLGSGMRNHVSLKAPGSLTVKFTPTTTLGAAGNFRITPHRDLFNLNGTIACTATSGGVSLPLGTSAVAAQGSFLHSSFSVLQVQLGSSPALAGDELAIRCSNNLAWNGPKGTVSFTVETDTDATPTTGVGYTIAPHNQVRWLSAAMSDSIVTAEAPGSLVIRVVPTNAMFGSTGIITLTPSRGIFGGDGPIPCTLQAIQNGALITKATPAALVTTGVLRVTVGDTCLPFVELIATCSTNVAVNGALGAVTFNIRTSTDELQLSGQTGYTVVASKSLAWGGAVLSQTPVAGKPAGSIVFTLTPSTTLRAGGTIKVSGNRGIWRGDNFGFSIPDTYRPIMDSYIPAQGATNVDIRDRILLTFSEEIYPGTGQVQLLQSTRTLVAFQETTGDYWVDTEHRYRFIVTIYGRVTLGSTPWVDTEHGYRPD